MKRSFAPPRATAPALPVGCYHWGMTWPRTTVISTPRLTLRCFGEDDLPAYASLNVDPEVVEFLGGPVTPEYTREIAEWANGLHEREGIGLLAVERTEDGAFLGMCGLHHLDSFPDDIEIAWRLAREHWGRGYATEAATAWLEYAFTVKRLPRVISVADPPNVRSVAVMKRLGMTYDRQTRIVEEGQEFEVVVYVITAESWAASRVGADGLEPPTAGL